MNIGGIQVLPGVMEGEDVRPRKHVRLGDIIPTRTPEGKFVPLTIRTREHIETFYRAAGIDYWTQDVDWIDE